MLNEIIGTAARFEQLLTRKFGLAGGAPSPQLTPEITPIFEIEGGPEGRILAGETLSSVYGEASAVAGKQSYVALSNPSGSGIVAVVSEVWLYTATAQNLDLRWTTGTPPAANLTCRQRDARKIGLPSCVARQGSDLGTDFPGSVLITSYVQSIGTPMKDLPIDIIVAPNTTLLIASTTVNVAIRIGINWREVPLARGEPGPF